jgi:hypothetical protein
MTKTTITVDPETHSNVLKMQSVLTLMSGVKCSLSDTINYSVNATLNSVSTTNASYSTANASYSTANSPSNTCVTLLSDAFTSASSFQRISLRRDK